MNKIHVGDFWLFWYRREDNESGFYQELEALKKLIEMEKEFPYKGNEWLRKTIKKKIIIQCKIRLLEGSVEA